MDELFCVIHNIDNQNKLLEKDVEYLAQCYIEDRNNFELPMSYEDTLIEIDYKKLLTKVRDKILFLSPTISIDEQLLMTYVDYYFQFINTTS